MSRISTVGGVQQEIAVRLNELNISANNEDRYLNWINLGLNAIWAEFPEAPWYERNAVLSLVAGSRTYKLSAIDSTLVHIFDVRISAQNSKLYYMPRNTFDSYDPKPDDSGVPRIYTSFGTDITFYPTPTTSDGAQVLYRRRPVYVSAASAVPNIPSRYLESLVMYGWSQGLYLREDFNEAQLIERKFYDMVNQMKAKLKQRTRDPQRFLSVREVNNANRVYNDEVLQAFFGP